MSTQKIKYTRLFLQRDEIAKIKPLYRKRYVMLTSIVRDVTLLSKCLHYVGNKKPKEEILQYANTMASLFFLTTLISKIYEMWVFITRNNILKELQQRNNSTELKKSIDDINTFFSNTQKKGVFEFIRHSFSCHYGYKSHIDPIISGAFDKFGDNNFQVYLTENDSANNVFPSVNSVIMMSIFQKMDELQFVATNEQKIKILFSLTGEGAKLVMEFCPIYLTEVFSIKWEKKAEEIEMEVPEISTIELPIITKNKTITKQSSGHFPPLRGSKDS